jgi:predicted N-acyltransferase
VPQDLTSADSLTVRLVASICDIEASAWDACANPAEPDPAAGESFNPFISHAFLSALEQSGSAVPATGWGGAHLVLESAGEALAVVPAYLKSHSRGEYVFDWGWAEAYERAGGQYYPKLQVSVPFTPVTGRRLLVRPGPDAGAAADALGHSLQTVMRRLGASSVHVTFASGAEQERLTALGFLPRIDQQYHWINEGYGSFEDFLTALASRKRKMIRRERRDALAEGITIERLTGRDLTEAHWDAFHGFYLDTGARKWGSPYLTRSFFSLIGERLPERILLVLASRNGRYIAGALNLIGDHALYGRNWGAIEEHPFLHFEVCYYQAIEFAIERGLSRVEAGAQGEHKLARGYRPTLTRSAHALADPALRRAVADYLERERTAVRQDALYLEEHLPFRADA